MPRIRTIKPEFCTSEQVAECSTTARLLFVLMWCHCDDAGRHPASVRRLKMECFPGDAYDVDEMNGFVGELMRAGLITEYEWNGKRFWQVTGWRHQKIDKPCYKYGPLNPNGTPAEVPKFDDHSTSSRRPVDEASPAEGSLREGKGEEGSGVLLLSASSGPSEYTQAFERFWEVYPKQRRSKKQEAFRRWKLALKRVEAETLISRAADYAASELGRSEFAVMPGVWLNAGMWEDEPEAWKRKGGDATATIGPGQRFDPNAEGVGF